MSIWQFLIVCCLVVIAQVFTSTLLERRRHSKLMEYLEDHYCSGAPQCPQREAEIPRCTVKPPEVPGRAK